MISPIRFLMLAVLALGWMSTASAHHSNAAYDMDHLLRTIEGTVKEVNWTNPHITFHVEEDAKDGKPAVEWVFEASSPGGANLFGLDKTLDPAGRSRHFSVCAASRWRLGRVPVASDFAERNHPDLQPYPSGAMIWPSLAPLFAIG